MNPNSPRRTVLHVGCGRAPLPAPFAHPGWREIRVDIDPAVRPDIVGTMTDLAAVADASVDAVYSSHNLEHLDAHEVPLALAEFRRVLKPGGSATILVPDVQSLAERIASGELETALYRVPAGPIAALDMLWGHGAALAAGQVHMAHRTGFSAATLDRRLLDAGFAPVEVQRRGTTYELEARATRPAAAAPLDSLLAQARQAATATRWAEAERLYRQVVAADARCWPAWYELGLTCYMQQRIDEAIAHTRRAVALQADFAPAQMALGAYLGMTGRAAEAVAPLSRSVALTPGSAEAQYNLGKALQDCGRLSEAARAYRTTLALDPTHGQAHLTLANVLAEQGAVDNPMPLYRRGAELVPHAYMQSNVAIAANFRPECSDAEVVQLHQDFERRVIAPLASERQPLRNSAEPARRLRIGYVSRDLRRHSLSYFLLPVVARHEHAAFEVCFYDDGDNPDPVTEMFRRHADRWLACNGMDDTALAERIRQDGIDILVDLGGQTDRNRLPVFGRKPAPVQVSWLGYPATTGVRAIDYRISDRWIDPPPPAAPIATAEMPLRLEHGYFCYAPIPGSPPVGPLPMDRRGHVCFGSLNQGRKLNAALYARWAEVLQGVPGSRLLLQHSATHDEGTQAAVRAEFARLGVAPERLAFRPYGRAPDYLQAYHEIDIALDAFPYSGGTTTCEALWMGVPVVSLAGGRHVGRLGLSLLNQVGLGDLVATTADDYVRLAIALAGDPPRLRSLRASMRERLQRSPLMDAAGFTRELEAGYRLIWQRWCASLSAG